MRLSTLVLAIGMALGAQAQAAETQPHADHSALPSGQAKEATVTGEANQHDKQKTQNPFFYQSRLPFQAPPFNLIKESDYAPAIEAGIKQSGKRWRRSPTTRPSLISRIPSWRWNGPVRC